ncbi:MAG TPA: hypothetical protein VMW52_02010 [Phycisphaerae bacterium]|nr:hypothetical protein [Phycisphaerae bacterium]
MAEFRDNEGRSWPVIFTTATFKRVHAALDVDLGRMVSDGSIYEVLADDPILLCNMLYVVCKPDADKRGLSDEDFGRGLAGDVIDDAITALMEGLIDFFPKARRRLHRKALAAFATLEKKALEKAEAMIDSGELEKEIDRRLASLSSATGSEESPESTPAP